MLGKHVGWGCGQAFEAMGKVQFEVAMNEWQEGLLSHTESLAFELFEAQSGLSQT